MSRRTPFADRAAFITEVEGLLRRGVPSDRISVITPVPVPEVEALLRPIDSPLKFFTLAGAVAGLLTGLSFTVYTVHAWPLVTGGKPLISWPPFIIIAFELTILFAAVASVAGFFLLSRTPSLAGITTPFEHDNRFWVIVADEETP